MSTADCFAIADDADRTYTEKIDAYLALADAYFDTARYREWSATHLPHLDEQVHDRVTSPEFDRMLLNTVRATYPPREHERFLAHFRGLLDLRARDQAR